MDDWEVSNLSIGFNCCFGVSSTIKEILLELKFGLELRLGSRLGLKRSIEEYAAS